MFSRTADSRKPQVLTMHVRAPSARSTGSKPASAMSPTILSLSTLFLAHPRLRQKNVPGFLLIYRGFSEAAKCKEVPEITETLPSGRKRRDRGDASEPALSYFLPSQTMFAAFPEERSTRISDVTL